MAKVTKLSSMELTSFDWNDIFYVVDYDTQTSSYISKQTNFSTLLSAIQDKAGFKAVRNVELCGNILVIDFELKEGTKDISVNLSNVLEVPLYKGDESTISVGTDRKISIIANYLSSNALNNLSGNWSTAYNVISGISSSTISPSSLALSSFDEVSSELNLKELSHKDISELTCENGNISITDDNKLSVELKELAKYDLRDLYLSNYLSSSEVSGKLALSALSDIIHPSGNIVDAGGQLSVSKVFEYTFLSDYGLSSNETSVSLRIGDNLGFENGVLTANDTVYDVLVGRSLELCGSILCINIETLCSDIHLSDYSLSHSHNYLTPDTISGISSNWTSAYFVVSSLALSGYYIDDTKLAISSLSDIVLSNGNIAIISGQLSVSKGFEYSAGSGITINDENCISIKTSDIVADDGGISSIDNKLYADFSKVICVTWVEPED